MYNRIACDFCADRSKVTGPAPLPESRPPRVSARASEMRPHDWIPIVALLFLTAWSATSCRPPVPDYEGYGYLIVAPEAVMPALDDFADYKLSRGFLLNEVSLEEILEVTPGDDGPEKIRNYLKGYATLTPEREFVLLVGSIDVVPMRMAHPFFFDHSDSTQVPTDFYYEELSAEWDADGDGFFGEYGDDMSQETEDYDAELLVGRIPWDEAGQIEAVCDAIMRYEEDQSARMTRALFAAATISEPCDTSLTMTLGDDLVFTPLGYDTTRLCENCPAANPDYELTGDSFVEQWEVLEPGFAFTFSHGTPYAAVLGDKETQFLGTQNMPQAVEPAVLTSTACSIGSPDSPEPSLGRVLVREGVCAAVLGASRWTWYGADPWPVLLAGIQLLSSLVVERRCLAEAKMSFVEYYVNNERVPENMPGHFFHQDLFLFMLYGDPSIQLR